MTEGKILYADHDNRVRPEGNRIPTKSFKADRELLSKLHELCGKLQIEPSLEENFSKAMESFIIKIHDLLCGVSEKPSEPLSETISEDPECSMRYFHNGQFYCFRNAPNSKELLHGLKMCESCRHRVTSEELQELENLQKVKTEYFCSLGVTHAKEDPDLFVCHDHNCFYHHQWIRQDACLNLEKGGCRFLKKVIVEPKAPPRS